MSLYRTWRPKSFTDLVGQDAVVTTLSHALESGKVAHAYLFSGPRGSGKTSAAKIMARCLNCIGGPTASPDNTCELCLSMLEGSALDVLEIDAASNRGIDEIRALRDAVKFAPSVMRKKVYIIDEAHMLTKEGANAFLKTLEEPPAHAVFILATTEPEKLPVTILSRCQRYAFRRIAIPTMIERMRTIAAAEGIAIDDDSLAAIAYRADGGLRDALTMLEQAAAFGQGDISLATLDLAFGATSRNYANSVLQACIDRDAAAALGAIEEASDAGADLHVLARALVAEFRNLLVAQIDPALLARDLAPEDAKRSAQRAPEMSQMMILRALRLLPDALAATRTSGNPRLEIETALLRLIFSDAPTVQAEPQAQPATAPVPSPRVAPAPPQSRAKPPERPPAKVPAPIPASGGAEDTGKELTLQRVRAAWSHIRAKAEATHPPLRIALSRAVVDAIDGTVVTLRMPDAWATEVLTEHLAALTEAVADVLGVALTIRTTLEAAAPRSKATAAPGPAEASEPNDENFDPDALFQYAQERIRES